MAIRPLRIWLGCSALRGTCLPLVALAAWSLPTSAEARGKRHLDIAADSLPQAIAALAQAYDAAIGGAGALPAIRPPALHGTMTLAEALAHVLGPIGWQARHVGGVWQISPTPANATPPPPPPPAPPSDILVTGTKRPVALSAVPMTMHIAQPDALSACAPQCDTGAIAAALTGMSVIGAGPGQNRLFLQGIADSPFNGAATATVAVMLDEARISYAGPEPDLRLVDVERVEVLEGPQGTLYGAGTLAGIYRIITAKPDPDAWGAHLSLSGDSEMTSANDGGTGGATTAMVNAPLGSGAAVRLVGYGESQPGWISTIGRATTNTTHTAGGRAALAIAPGATWGLEFSGAHQTIATADSAYVYAGGQYQRPAQSAEPYASQIDVVAARAHGKWGAADVTLASSITWAGSDQTLDASVGAGDLGLADPSLYHDRWRSRLWDNEARITGHAGRFDWLAGLSWFRADMADTQTLAGVSGDMASLANSTRIAQEAALFGDLAWHFARGWQVDIGAREFHATLADTVTLAQGAPTPLRQTHNAISPSASLSWHLAPRDTLYLRLASAFRQGDIRGDSDENHNVNASILPGDQLDTVELGWRRAWANKGEMALAAHASRWRDVQSDSLTDHAAIVTRDAGDARVLGAEGHVTTPPWAGWHMTVAGEYEAATLVKNALNIVLDDTRLPVVPTYTASWSLAHDVHVGAGQGTLGLNLRQVGPGRLSFDPELDRRIGPRLETGLSGQLRRGHFDVSINVDNVLGASSDTFAYGNPFRLAEGAQHVPMRPRTIRLTLGFTP